MRLYLSSFRVGDHPDRLVEMVGNDRRAAVVFNATDGSDPVERADRLERELDALESLGLEPEELDLRDFFDAQGDPYRSPDHPETEVIDEVVDWFIDNHVPFVALRDGEVIIADGGSPKVLPASN